MIKFRGAQIERSLEAARTDVVLRKGAEEYYNPESIIWDRAQWAKKPSKNPLRTVVPPQEESNILELVL